MTTKAFILASVALALTTTQFAQAQAPGSIAPVGGRIGNLGGRRMGFASPYAVQSRLAAQRPRIQSIGGSVGRGGSTWSGGGWNGGLHPSHPICDPWPDNCWPSACASPGLTVNGVFVDDNFALGIHVGSPGWCAPLYSYGYSWYPYYYSDYYYGYDYAPVTPAGYYAPVDTAVHQQPAAPAPAPQPELPESNLEWGKWSLANGEPAKAAEALQLHLADNPNDFDAMRLLAVALLEDRRIREAVALIEMAHRADPELGAHLIAPVEALGGVDLTRKALRNAVTFAHDDRSGWAWLTVAAMMQVEGRPSALILEMLGRARETGLDERYIDPVERVTRR